MPASLPVLELGSAHMTPPPTHPTAAAIPHDIQAQLYREADARFAAQTGITWKLDPKSWIDQAMIPSWNKIYEGVLRDYHAGTLHLTHPSPVVQAALGKAADAHAQASQHAASAMSAPSQKAAQVHGEAAKTQIQAAQDHGLVAAAAQPPPSFDLWQLVKHGADQVARQIGPWLSSGASLSVPTDVAKAAAVVAAPAQVQAASNVATNPLAPPDQPMPSAPTPLTHEETQIAEEEKEKEKAKAGAGKKWTAGSLAITGGLLAGVALLGVYNMRKENPPRARPRSRVSRPYVVALEGASK